MRVHNARKRKVKPLSASQSLSETFPCTRYKAFSLKGKALKGNRVARIGICAHRVHRLRAFAGPGGDIHIHLHMYICTHTCNHTYTRTHVYTYTHIHIYTYTHIHIHKYIDTSIHLHTYTYLHHVSVRRFPSFRTQPLENLSQYQ